MNSWDDIVSAGSNTGIGPIDELWRLGIKATNTADRVANNTLDTTNNLSDLLNNLLNGNWFYIIIGLVGAGLVVQLVKK
jgi:hypothetical protein